MFSLPSSLPLSLQLQLCHLLHCIGPSISLWPSFVFPPSHFSPISVMAVSWQEVR